MSNVTLYQSLNMSAAFSEFISGYVTKATNNTIVFKSYSGNKSGTYSGTFSYDSDGYLDGGNIKGYSFTVANVKQYAITALSISTSVYEYYEAYDDAAGLVQYALRSADTVNGSAASDVIHGYNGNDTLKGMGGNDRICGGLGSDKLYGGSGKDVFDLNKTSESGISASTRDVIADFARGVDKIDLASIDANIGIAGNNAFTKIIASGVAFTAAGQLRLTSGVLYGNIDSDAVAEFSIQLSGIGTLSLADFIL